MPMVLPIVNVVNKRPIMLSYEVKEKKRREALLARRKMAMELLRRCPRATPVPIEFYFPLEIMETRKERDKNGSK